MKSYKLLALAVIPLILSGCNKNPEPKPGPEPTPTPEPGPKNIPGLVEKDIDIKMVSLFDDFGEGEVEDTCFYSDYWFTADSFTKNYKLALMSAYTGGMSYCNALDNNGQKISKFLTDADYKHIQMNEYYSSSVTLHDSIGVIMANKKMKDWDDKEYTLLAAFPRNAGYGNEWYGNFNMGISGVHTGFALARDEMLRFMKHYIAENNIEGELKLWIAGYSRGAAVVNLVSGFLGEQTDYLGDKVTLNPHNIYSYTIGTPRTITTDSHKADVLNVTGPRGEGYLDTNVPAYEYKGEDAVINPTAEKFNFIKSFTAVGDYITKLPPESWNFTRYGEVESPKYGSKEFITNLRQYDAETAAKFNNKDYTTESSVTFFDLETLRIIDTGEKISANKTIDERIEALMSLGNGREGTVNNGYTSILGALTGIFGTSLSSFIDSVTQDKGALAKALAFTYLAHAQENMGGELSNGEVLANILMDVMDLVGKDVIHKDAYTDQDLLKDLLDYLINDYQTSSTAVARSLFLSVVLPAPYGQLYVNVLKYAKEHEIKATTVESLLNLIASYATDKKEEDPAVEVILSAIAGLIPENYVPLIGWITGKVYSEELYPDPVVRAKTAVSDLLYCCSKGLYSEEKELVYEADYIRTTVLSVLTSFVLTGTPNLNKLIMNGTFDEDGKQTINDPVLLSVTCEEILTKVLPVDEDKKPLSFADAADQSLAAILEAARTEGNAQYVDILKEKPNLLREMVIEVLLQPGEKYDLLSELINAYHFYNTIQFLAPAHFHEMYISYLKTQID